MSDLFDRVCTVSVDTHEWSGLHVAFRVTRTSSKSPNTADISIFNLSEASRASIGEKGQRITLIAGYKGNAALVFAGQVMQCQHKRVPCGWETVIEARDGHTQWLARAKAAYGSATKHRTVLQQLARDMGLSITPAQLDLVGDGETRGPLVLHGYAQEAFETLCRTLELEWSIQDGTLQLLPLDSATRETAVVLTPETGLVGAPEIEAGKPGQKGKTAKASSLLQPLLRPGRRVELQSRTLTGSYRCETVVHAGDTAGLSWYSECELREI